jgi:hypothetical protein
MASVIWGWRLEAALILSLVVGAKVASLFGSGGPVLGGGLLAIGLWQSPVTRDRIAEKLTAARRRRRLVAAFRSCQTVGTFGDAPRITKSESVLTS